MCYLSFNHNSQFFVYLYVWAHVIAGRDLFNTSVFGDPSDITLGATYFIYIDSLLLLYHVIIEKY